ncbi:MAG: ribosome biogenesis GTPase Der [Clostridia bacterium]
MSKPVFAIIGRPNVGKSTFFNKLIGQRISIIEDTPGVTRDRIYAEGEWLNKPFILIDTGGIEINSEDAILKQMKMQAEIAIATADVIIMLTEIGAGVTAADIDVATLIQKSGKPIILVVNKVDNIGQTPLEIYEFYNLGLGDPMPVSSVHGRGTGDLLDKAFELAGDSSNRIEDEDAIKVAVIGKPNVGKSSLINNILGENRVIVSDVAGTTRDAIDSYFENDKGKFVFIDTAGIRRHAKVNETIEKYSVLRAKMAVERCDVAIIMLDAREGVTEQDTKIAGFAHEAGKGCIVVANKWDITDKNGKTMDKMRKEVQHDLPFMSYAPVLFISALTGQRVDKLFELIDFVSNQNSMRISTGLLNEILSDAVTKVQPPSDKGKRLKLLYITQPSTKPPTFVIFVNNKDLFHFSYQRYIENQIRNSFGLEGTPIRIIVRERGDKSSD